MVKVREVEEISSLSPLPPMRGSLVEHREFGWLGRVGWGSSESWIVVIWPPEVGNGKYTAGSYSPENVHIIPEQPRLFF